MRCPVGCLHLVLSPFSRSTFVRKGKMVGTREAEGMGKTCGEQEIPDPEATIFPESGPIEDPTAGTVSSQEIRESQHNSNASGHYYRESLRPDNEALC